MEWRLRFAPWRGWQAQPILTTPTASGNVLRTEDGRIILLRSLAGTVGGDQGGLASWQRAYRIGRCGGVIGHYTFTMRDRAYYPII